MREIKILFNLRLIYIEFNIDWIRICFVLTSMILLSMFFGKFGGTEKAMVGMKKGRGIVSF